MTSPASPDVFVWSARLAKSGKPHRELLCVPAASVPPGAGFVSRHDAKQHAKHAMRAPRLDGTAE